MNLTECVEQSIAARRLFSRKEAILLAVSGGLDSMVLLHVLAQLARANRWRLTVAHYNHQLRGRSSDADERLVRRTAEKLGVPFVSGRADVREFAREQKLSLEMGARKLRHKFLAAIAKERGIKKIALAHHADDQVELFFVRLLRGAGGEGLAGMKWMGPSPADPKIFLARPLLDQPKTALAAYAKSERVPFREDATNHHLDIQRNRIRHKLLPLLQKHYQPALARVVLRQMEILGAEAEAVNEVARAWLHRPHGGKFESLPVAVQRRCLQGHLTKLELAANFDLIEQLRLGAFRPVSIGKNSVVSRDAAGWVSVKDVPESGSAEFGSGSVNVRLSGQAGEIVFDQHVISWQVILRADGTFRAPKRQVNCECFDAGKLGADIVLRHWQPGDRFQPIGLPQPAKLQDLFTNQKIVRKRRHGLLVGATAKGEIFWVEGLRMGERFKLDKATRYQLKWRWKGLC